jgi:hypothetical protein
MKASRRMGLDNKKINTKLRVKCSGSFRSLLNMSLESTEEIKCCN